MFLEILLIGFLIYIIYKLLKPTRPNNFPPGPDAYPIVGSLLNVFTLDKYPPKALQKLGDIYGPVSSFCMGVNWAIVVNTYEAAKEVLTRDEFSERPDLYLFTSIWNGKRMGLILGSGEAWKEQRRFTMRNLRDFGFGKSSLESVIQEEVTTCIQFIKKTAAAASDSIISLEDVFSGPVLSVLWVITSGKRILVEDENMMAVLEKISASHRTSPRAGIFNEYPLLRYFPGISKDFNEFTKGVMAVNDILYKEIEEHVRDRDKNDSRDFIDVYLKQMEEEKEKGFTKTTFTHSQLVAVVNDLFSAGAESTSNSVAYAVLYMILYPEVQEKVQKEIDSVVGKDRLPSVSDRANLHYTEAVLTEVLRISPVTPVGPPRCNSSATTFCGYDVPKDSSAVVNIYAIHMDKSYWGDPEVFRPERFVDSNGKFVKPERMLTFGLGKRNCIGEPLARMNYYAFFASVMQNFELKMVPGMPKPSTAPNVGITMSPQPFQAQIRYRL